MPDYLSLFNDILLTDKSLQQFVSVISKTEGNQIREEMIMMKTLKLLASILFLTVLNTHTLAEENHSPEVNQEGIVADIYHEGLGLLHRELPAGREGRVQLQAIGLQYLVFSMQLGNTEAELLYYSLGNSFQQLIGFFMSKLPNETTVEKMRSKKEIEAAEFLYSAGEEILEITSNIVRPTTTYFGLLLLIAANHLGHPTAQQMIDLVSSQGYIVNHIRIGLEQ